MLTPQENAWAVYAAVFLFFTIFLSLRCRKNLLLIPFVVFGMLVTIGTICLLAAHSGVSSTMSSALGVNPSSYSIDRYWQSKSLVLSIMSAASVLLLFGIMEAQLIFIRHMAVAIHNRDHWGSIYLRDPEKSQGFISKSKNKKKASLRPWTYWTSLIVMAVYLIVAICNGIIQTTVANQNNKNLGVAVCVSILCILACFNVGVILSSSSTNHIRTIRRNRDDLLFLRFTPILFSIFMVGMMMLSWIYYSMATVPIAAWIVLESFTVYLPLILILIMCIYTGKIQTMGRQYPIEVAQQRKLYSYSTVKDMESVTKKLSQEEANKQISTPPPATYSGVHHH